MRDFPHDFSVASNDFSPRTTVGIILQSLGYLFFIISALKVSKFDIIFQTVVDFFGITAGKYGNEYVRAEKCKPVQEQEQTHAGIIYYCLQVDDSGMSVCVCSTRLHLGVPIH